MKNFIEKGEALVYTNTSGSTITSGTAILTGGRIGVATVDIANNAKGIMAMVGVFNIPKLSTDVVAQGDLLYWDDTNKELTTTAAGNTLTGPAWAGAGNGVTTVDCKINA